MAEHKTFRAALVADMARLGLTEAALGRRLNISQQAVHKWVERGFPPLARLEELCQILGSESEVSKMSHEEIYAKHERPEPKTRPMQTNPTSGTLLAQSTHRQHHEALKAQLPTELHQCLQAPIPDASNTPLRVDFANAEVVAETVTIVGDSASRNIQSALLQLMLYRQKVPTIKHAVLLVMCEDLNRPLPRLAEETMSVFGIEVLRARDGDMAARGLAQMLGVRVNVELHEPEE